MYPSGSERGYLHEQFRLFHTKEQCELQVDWHYHTFDKLIFFLSGNVDYSVENETYHLRPGDMLTISHGQLHRMHAYGNAPYERIILYLNHSYLSSLASEAGGLSACFDRARMRSISLLRFQDADRAFVSSLLQKLERVLTSASPYRSILSQALLTELMVFLCQHSEKNAAPTDIHSDDKIAQALIYIQSHLGDNLSCDTLAAHLYMSRSSFQHRFRDATGYPPHAYIRLKRLLLAAELLTEGKTAMQAGKLCGYTDHSAFCHAFTQQYGMPPSQFRPHSELETLGHPDE